MKWCHILISECLEEIKFLHLSAPWNPLWSLPGEHRLGHKPPTLSSSEEMRDLEWQSYMTTFVVWWTVVCHSSSVRSPSDVWQPGEGESRITLCKTHAKCPSPAEALARETLLTVPFDHFKGAARFPWLYLQHAMMHLSGTHLSSELIVTHELVTWRSCHI